VPGRDTATALFASTGSTVLWCHRRRAGAPPSLLLHRRRGRTSRWVSRQRWPPAILGRRDAQRASGGQGGFPGGYRPTCSHPIIS